MVPSGHGLQYPTIYVNNVVNKSTGRNANITGNPPSTLTAGGSQTMCTTRGGESR